MITYYRVLNLWRKDFTFSSKLSRYIRNWTKPWKRQSMTLHLNCITFIFFFLSIGSSDYLSFLAYPIKLHWNEQNPCFQRPSNIENDKNGSSINTSLAWLDHLFSQSDYRITYPILNIQSIQHIQTNINYSIKFLLLFKTTREFLNPLLTCIKYSPFQNRIIRSVI